MFAVVENDDRLGIEGEKAVVVGRSRGVDTEGAAQRLL
jgi:hypothetical protein